jgi:3-hydroxyisobutyrate dehydrogenase
MTKIKLGISPEKALKSINNSSGRSWVTQQRFPDHILPETYDYGFSLDLLKKDVDTAKTICEDYNTDSSAFLIHKKSELLEKAQQELPKNSDHLEIYKLFK